MTYEEVLQRARERIGEKCKCCPVCNGVACGSRIPGPGAKGSGTGAIRNFNAWQKVLLNMDTISEPFSADTSFELFGRKFALPVFAGPVGSVMHHYGEQFDDSEYNRILISSCAENGIAAFVGDGIYDDGTYIEKVFRKAAQSIGLAGGCAVPTIKPWDFDTVREKISIMKEASPFAMAMDIDASGLQFLKYTGQKSVEELSKISREAGVPFIIKGIMTAKSALKAEQAGAAGIVVSNHGGRVLDGSPATAEVLPEIAEAVGGRMKVLVDGGIRSGTDIFRALALGADAVIVTRPFVSAIFGAEGEGIRVLVQKLRYELCSVMEMCGARNLDEIVPEMIRLAK